MTRWFNTASSQPACSSGWTSGKHQPDLRNWLIGLYIAEYELRGADRAKYGEKLLALLSKELKKHHISSTGRRQLYNYLSFYRVFPEIARTVSAQLQVPPEKLINTLSYSPLELFVVLDDPLKRAFYEIECIRGNWSVRELKRQIVSLYYERSGLSNNKKRHKSRDSRAKRS